MTFLLKLINLNYMLKMYNSFLKMERFIIFPKVKHNNKTTLPAI